VLNDIQTASANRLRYLKFFLYNDESIQVLTRQEKQRLWDAIRLRETALQTAASVGVKAAITTVQPPIFRQPNAQRQVVRVTPRSV
jgi:transposase